MPRHQAFVLLSAFAVVAAFVGACTPSSGSSSGSASVDAAEAGAPAASASPRGTDNDGAAASGTTFREPDLDGHLEGGVRPDEWGPPEPVRIDFIKKMCAAGPCEGPLARVHVYYERGIHRYAFEGDLTKCSHPPMVVYDHDGKELGRIANEPIEKGSAREKELDAKWQALFGRPRASAGSATLAEGKPVSFDCKGNVRK